MARCWSSTARGASCSEGQRGDRHGLVELHERRVGSAVDALPFVFTAPAPLRGLVYALLLLALVILGAPSGVEFIYFQF